MARRHTELLRTRTPGSEIPQPDTITLHSMSQTGLPTYLRQDEKPSKQVFSHPIQHTPLKATHPASQET